MQNTIKPFLILAEKIKQYLLNSGFGFEELRENENCVILIRKSRGIGAWDIRIASGAQQTTNPYYDGLDWDYSCEYCVSELDKVEEEFERFIKEAPFRIF